MANVNRRESFRLMETDAISTPSDERKAAVPKTDEFLEGTKWI